MLKAEYKRWAGYVSSLSGVRGFGEHNGEEKVKELLGKMIER